MAEETDEDSILPLEEDDSVASFLWNAYRTSKHSDVAFRMRTTSSGSVTASYYAHKFVLALWSPYFADMFYGPGNAKETVIFIDDINPNAFKNMLKYMYGCIYIPKSVKEAHEQYIVAARFKVASLVEHVQNIVDQTRPNISNVFDLVAASDCTNNPNLKLACVSFIGSHTSEIFSWFRGSSDTDYISPSDLHLILDYPKLSLCSEYELLKFVFMWGRAKLHEDVPQHWSAIREIIGEFLPKLNFTALCNEDFAELYSNFPGFLNESEALSIFLNIAKAGSYPMPDWYSKEVHSREYAKIRRIRSLKFIQRNMVKIRSFQE